LFRVTLMLLFSISVHADTLSLCAYFNWSPWIYLKGGGYEGILIDQLAIFKEKYPTIKIEILEINNWKRCQVNVAAGDISMVLGANKTPEREKVFDYLPIPAFVNKSSIGAYTSKNSIDPVMSLDDLKKYTISFSRGDRFGAKVDSFIETLPARNVFEVNSFNQTIKLVGINRVDYFFIPDSSYKSTMLEHSLKYPDYKHLRFKKILTVQRETPVFYVFGKNTGNYEKFADKWLNVINLYYKNEVIENRIKFHKENSGN